MKLVEIRDGVALLEVDGRRLQMGLGAATAARVVLQADRSGHFIATALVNGVPLQALVDTGASAVSMNLSDAQRAGVTLQGARRVHMMTAGGAREALLVRLAWVRIGDILVHDVEAAVSETNELPITLLGMSFLRYVEMHRSGASLTLTRRH